MNSTSRRDLLATHVLTISFPDWESNPAFDALKKKLCEYPILRLPDLSKPYVVVTDASNTGLGAALCQRVNNKLVVIEYASRSLTDAEKNYTRSE